MKKQDLLRLCSRYPYFDLAFLIQVSGERVEVINQNVKRWLADGTLLPLRRGMYTLAGHLRKAEMCPPRLANDLYAPSYLTDAWALSFHGLIPDVAREYTSATMRRPRTFENHLGVFSYRHMSQKYFWGFETVQATDAHFRCATPEKALIDHWYRTPGDWTMARQREMRFQNLERLNLPRLRSAVRRVNKPRIARAHASFLETMKEESP